MEQTTSACVATKTVTVGHSLGGVQALFTALAFGLDCLPALGQVMTVSCALPRVRAKFSSMTRAASRLLTSETKESANHVDLQPPILRRIANNRDPIPLLPGELSVFNHPSGQGRGRLCFLPWYVANTI